MPKYRTIGWEQLHADSRALAAALLAEGSVAGIVAVSRGGLVPAAIVAREIGCRVVESVSVASYESEAGSQQAPRLLKPPVAAGDGSGWVIVDDLVDSGVTARVVRDLLPKARFACLYAKPNGEALADRYVSAVPQDVWVMFPWDTAPQFVKPLAAG